MTTIKLKRSDVPGKKPLPEDLELGELALNTADGDLFLKKNDGTVESVGGAELRQELGNNSTTQGSDLIAHTGTSDTVTEALGKRAIYVGSVAELNALPSPQSGQQALVSGVPFEYIAGSWSPSAHFVTPEIYGAVGDDIADDTAAWTSALDTGVDVLGRPGATYKVTASLPVQNTTVDLRGATVRFVLDGAVLAFDVWDNSTLTNGSVVVEGTAPSGGWEEGSGAFQAPVVVGDYDTGVGRNNVEISRLSIESNRDNGNGILVTGDSTHVRIRNITFPDSPSIGRAILIHWGGFNNGGTITTTYHPHDITIENIQCGEMTNTGANAAVIFLSATYNVDIRNVYVDKCDVAIFNFAGDWGSSKADKYARWIGSNISVDNVVAPFCRLYGLRVNGKPYLGGSPIATQMVVRNMVVNGGPDTGTDGLAGVFLQNCIGVLVERSRFSVFDYGALSGEAAYRNTFHKCEFSNIRNSGVMVHNVSAPPEDWWFNGCEFHFVNTNLVTTGTDRACVYIGASVRTRVTNCIMGLAHLESGKYGVRSTAAAEGVILEGNHVRGLETTGATAIAYAPVTPVLGSGNTAASGLLLFGDMSAVVALGRGFQWVDATGKVRVSNTFPTGDTSGVVVGSQA